MWPFGKVSNEKFAKMVAGRMRRQGLSGALEYDSDNFALVSDQGTSFLANMYAEYYAAPFLQRGRMLDAYIASFLAAADAEMPSSLDDARASLLPKVRERFFHESMDLQGRVRDKPFPTVRYRVMAEHLAVDVVYDTPNAVATISSDNMGEWGVTYEEALAIARDNLWAISNEPFGELGPGTYVSTWQDTHDATRMFLHDLVWQLDVKGSHVVMVPDRNVLLATGSDDAEGLVRIAKEAEHILNESPRPLCGLAFILNGSTWEPYLPPTGAPAYDELNALACQYMANLYSGQKALLEALHERDGTDIFVATYAAMQNRDTGYVWSWCTWASGVDSLLPVTGLVAMVDTSRPKDEQQLGFARWPEVISIAEAILEPCPDMYPLRYRVREFPSQEQLAQIEFVEQ